MKRNNVRIAQALSSVARVARLVMLVVFAGLFASACQESNDPGVLTNLVILPNPATVVAGTKVQLTAIGTDFAGTSVAPNPGTVVWSVVAGGGTIDATTGLFTAGTKPGTYLNTVVATCRGISAQATVIVTPGPLVTITVTPNPTLAIGAQATFTAVGKDAFGNVVAITPTWSVVVPAGTVAAGTFPTGATGETAIFTAGNTPGVYTDRIKATQGTVSGTATVTVIAGPLATITVTPNPDTLAIRTTHTFTAVGKDAAGNVVTINPSWTVANGGGTIPSGTTGLTAAFTSGDALGNFANTVKATQGTVSGTATVTVIAGPLASITVTPNPDTLAVRATDTFTAVGKDAGGNVVAINPTWSVVNGGGTIPSGTTGQTARFTAGDTPGKFDNTVKATQGTVSGTATVVVVTGPLATITVTPNPDTLGSGVTHTFTAVGKDAAGNVVTINPSWSVVNGGGTIPSGTTGQTAPFTAGTTTGTFANTVKAAQGSISGTATVVVTAPFPPVSTFRLVARVAYTCTNGSITGDVGTNQTASEVPPGSVTQTLCPITGGTAQVGTTAAKQAYQDFLVAYAAAEATACGTTLTGTLAGVTLAPGVYCFSAAASLTGTLTLNGPGVYLFKVGTSGTGGLTGSSFNVVLAGGASGCDVTWLVRDATTFTTSNFRGAILGGGAVSFTGGTLKGSAYSKEDVTVTGTAVTPCGTP